MSDATAARAIAIGLFVVGVVGCSATTPEPRRAPPPRAWVLWAVHRDYIGDPEILRPMDSYLTQRDCELYKSALVKVQVEKRDKLDRENEQRPKEKMHFPRNITTDMQCWPDTVDPRGPKGVK